MIIQQLSVFLENKTGRLTDVTAMLGEAGINLSAFTIAESSDFGIMRMIVSEPERAKVLLREKGIAVSLTDVICLKTPNTPGALNKVLQMLSNKGVAVDYMYAFSESDYAKVVIRAEKMEDCIRILQEAHQNLLDAKEMYSFHSES